MGEVEYVMNDVIFNLEFVCNFLIVMLELEIRNLFKKRCEFVVMIVNVCDFNDKK